MCWYGEWSPSSRVSQGSGAESGGEAGNYGIERMHMMKGEGGQRQME